MRRLLAAVALVVIATTLPPARAQARPPVRLMCAVWTGGFHLVPRLRPKQCEIPVEAPVKLSAMVWRDWGKPYAKSRASIALDDGSRTRGTVTAYRRRPDCTGRLWIYTRLRLNAPQFTMTLPVGACSTG
jgi:hypothetical protein